MSNVIWTEPSEKEERKVSGNFLFSTLCSFGILQGRKEERKF